MKKNKLLSLFFALLLLMPVLPGCSGDNNPTPGATDSAYPIIISEIMSSNRTTITDEDGDYVDYIELYNGGKVRVNLKDCYLSDDPDRPQQYKLPSLYLEPGQYLVLFASGKNKSNFAKGIFHTNFKISSQGETITLTGPEGQVICSVQMPPSIPDVAYGCVLSGEQKGQYMWFAEGMPGRRNTSAYAPSIDELTFDTVTLYINEYMTKNTYTLYDEEGDYSDWIEIYNPNDTEVMLGGLYLTDRLNDVEKWQIPQGVTIPAKGYKIIFLSGKDKVTQSGEIHAGFRLGREDNIILLANERGKKIDAVELILLEENVSRGRALSDINKWQYFPTATPGEANTTQGFDDL